MRPTVGLSNPVTLDPLKWGRPELLWSRCGGKCIWFQHLRGREKNIHVFRASLGYIVGLSLTQKKKSINYIWLILSVIPKQEDHDYEDSVGYKTENLSQPSSLKAKQ